jgi:hypothetical protein
MEKAKSISPLKLLLAGLALTALVFVCYTFVSSHSGVESAAATSNLRELFSDRLGLLRQCESREDFLHELEALKTFFQLQDREKAVAMVLAWLEEGEDLTFPMRFQTGPGSWLGSWPSLRVFLLDLLFHLDPEAAREMSLNILEESSSPDEWAIAFRNIGKFGLEEDRAVLEEKSRELIQREAWREKPTAGYLEAFDVIVHLEQTEVVPELGRIMNGESHPAVAFASMLVLNRLAERQPESTLQHLVREKELMKDYPEARAELFARVDVRRPASAKLLRTYLITPERSPLELEHFAETFPHGGQFVSNSLLTGTYTKSGADIRAADEAALSQVRAWMRDPKMKKVRPYLKRTERRLMQLLK